MASIRLLAIVIAATLSLPAHALFRVEGLPKPIQEMVWEMTEACQSLGGKPGDAMQAVEAADLDGNGLSDVIFDEGRFPCQNVRDLCPKKGCSTFVYLNLKGEWKPVFDVVGSYCLDRTQDPPKFMTIQKNYLVSGDFYILNIRYRFEKGMAFQEGRGKCPE